MQKWELHLQTAWINKHTSASDIWTEKDKKTGKTAWDLLQAAAAEGWELVSVTPVNHSGFTGEILFSFKRPLVEYSIPIQIPPQEGITSVP